MTALFRPTLAGVLAAGAVAFLAMTAPAQAVPFSGTFTYGGGTNQTYDPNGPATLVANASSVTEGTDQSILTLTGAPGMVGQFLIYAAQVLTIPAADSGTIGNIQINWGYNSRFSFVSTLGTYARDALNSALNFKWYGTFTDSMGIFDTQVAQVTQGWSQASNGQQPNTGGTFNSDPTLRVPTGVPEPASMALFGMGLLGLGFVVRRRGNAANRETALS